MPRQLTIRDILNRIFTNQDETVDLSDLDALDVNDNDKNLKNENNDKKQVEDVTTEEVKTDANNVAEIKEEKKMAVPKYNLETGLFDLSGIEDEELKAELKKANDKVKADRNQAIINTAISERLKTVNKIDGITDTVLTSLLDRTNIKVVDGVAQGVNEAFDKLISEQKGLFKEAQKTEVKQVKKEVSSPITEGFAPVNNSANGKLSFAEAIQSKTN